MLSSRTAETRPAAAVPSSALPCDALCAERSHDERRGDCSVQGHQTSPSKNAIQGHGRKDTPVFLVLFGDFYKELGAYILFLLLGKQYI